MREEIRTIESIMRQQTELYERFAAIEEKKSEELMARSGLLIERYAREQERLVSEIELLEAKRTAVVHYLAPLYSLEPVSATVSQIAEHLDADQQSTLRRCAAELRRVMDRVRVLVETNQMMIKDNIELFRVMLEGFRESASDTGIYSAPGIPKASRGAVLINRTA